jgi:hypothetical protein
MHTLTKSGTIVDLIAFSALLSAFVSTDDASCSLDSKVNVVGDRIEVKLTCEILKSFVRDGL